MPSSAVTQSWTALKASWRALDGSPFIGAQAYLRVKTQPCHPPEHEMGERQRSHTDPQWWCKEVSKFQELEIQPTSNTRSVNRETEASKTRGRVSYKSLLPDLCPLAVQLWWSL